MAIFRKVYLKDFITCLMQYNILALRKFLDNISSSFRSLSLIIVSVKSTMLIMLYWSSCWFSWRLIWIIRQRLIWKLYMVQVIVILRRLIITHLIYIQKTNEISHSIYYFSHNNKPWNKTKTNEINTFKTCLTYYICWAFD